MKKIISIITALTMIISILALSVVADNAEQEETPDLIIRIVHTNDIYARIEESENSGIIGAEKLKTIIDNFKSNCDMSLVLDSGDIYHGQSIATVSQGEAVADVIKELGYDAVTVGNHDWNYGQERLSQLVEASGTVMLAGNVVKEDGNRFFENEFLIKTAEKDGKSVKIGIFGVTDPDIYRMTSPKLLLGLTYTDAVQYANEAAKALREQGCDIVIALTHTHKPAAFAEKVSGVDMWLAGHEHMLIDTAVTAPDGKTAYVYEDGYYLYNVGCYEIGVNLTENGVNCKISAEHLDYGACAEYEKNAAVTSLIAGINEKQSDTLNQKAGYSPDDLDGVWEHLRTGETTLGRAVTSAYLLLTDADIAFENAGGIRASVKKGDLSYGDIIAISPFGNMVVTKKLSGADILAILENNIELELLCIAADESGQYDAWPQNSGSYIQAGGVTVKYDPLLENGHRIISAYVGDKPLDAEAYYTVATNNYFAGSLPVLCDAEVLNEYTACEQALISYFSQDAEIIASDTVIQRMIKTVPDEPAETEADTENPEKSPETGGGKAIIYVTLIITVSAAMFAALAVSGKKSRI